MNGMVDLKAMKLAQSTFNMNQEACFYYASSYIERIIAEIEQGIMTRKGLLVISGNTGVGKTVIVRRILKSLDGKGVHTVRVATPDRPDADLIRKINLGLGAADDPELPPEQLGVYLQQYGDLLSTRIQNGQNIAIVIDDAQNLQPRNLALLQLLFRLDNHREKRVQFLLAGQTELISNLNAFAMGQVEKSVAIRKILRPLSRQEMHGYIRHRLDNVAQKSGVSITGPAMRRLYHCSGGNFRQLNLLLDRCLDQTNRLDVNRINRRHVGLAHGDLHPDRFRHTIRHLAASLTALGAAVLASWILHLQVGRSSMADTVHGLRHYKVPYYFKQDFACDPPAVAPDAAAMKKTHPPGSPDPALATFLNIYQLNGYYHDFQRALAAGRLESIARRIYAEKGYQLIQLAHVPDSIRRRYGALTFCVAAGRTPEWLLFWKPQIRLKRFYHSYKGEEIERLQDLLAQRDYYHYQLDGIVGPRLMNALQSFQKDAGLRVTGFPDAETVFWLCHHKAAKASRRG